MACEIFIMEILQLIDSLIHLGELELEAGMQDLLLVGVFMSFCLAGFLLVLNFLVPLCSGQESENSVEN